MSENLKNRLKNYSFWVSLASAILLLVQAIGKPLGLVINEELYMSIVNSVLGVFVVLGIISHPAQSLIKDTTAENENITNNVDNSSAENSTANAKVANTIDFSASVENSANNEANLSTTQTGNISALQINTSAAQVENLTTLQTDNAGVMQAKNSTMQVENASTMQTKSAQNGEKTAVNSDDLQNSSTIGLTDSVLPFGKAGENLSLAEQTDNKSNSADSAHNIDAAKTADIKSIAELKAEILKSIK